MKEFIDIEAVFFLGIGGIGMSALARYFVAGGYHVAGYDRTRGAITRSLEDEGCSVIYEDNTMALPALFSDPSSKSKVVVVVTPAIPKESILLNYFIDQGYTMYKRSQILGFVSERSDTVAVAGTHGKTTVSTMAAHLLTVSSVGCSAFLGGISRNYNSNLLLGNSTVTVMEADEFDRSFLTLSPLIAVITAIDPDHLDIYGNEKAMEEAYSDFCHKIRRGGTLIVNESVAGRLNIPGNVTVYTYGTGEAASFRAANIAKGDGYYTFDILTPGDAVTNIRLLMPGMVNILNATAAASAAWVAGAKGNELRNGLLLYKGVKRRFDVRYSGLNLIYVDDYAHHPEEINALVDAVHDFYPGRPVRGIFQPHLYSRTRDFAEGFAKALDKLDEIWLLELYPAREKPLPGVNSEMIAGLMKNSNVKIVSKDEILRMADIITEGILLTIGAGDIDSLVEPLEKKLKERGV